MLSSNSPLQVFFGSFWHDTGSESLTPLERAAYNQLGCQVWERHVTEKLSKMQDAKSRSFTTESLNIWENFAEINNNVSVFFTHGLIATVIVNAHGNCLDGREGLELCSAPFSPQSFFFKLSPQFENSPLLLLSFSSTKVWRFTEGPRYHRDYRLKNVSLSSQ